MAQALIVEGNDAIFISSLLEKKRVAFPKGYTSPKEIKNEFIKKAGGFGNVNKALREVLQSTDVTNIGVIVDADDKGAKARFESLIHTIKANLSIAFPTKSKLPNTGFVYRGSENLTIGIWVMPDNIAHGYLEHFVANLIPARNQTWQFAKEVVTELASKEFCEFTTVKQQKALIHTYLAWQKKPGLPMGTAIRSNFMEVDTAVANLFVDWFKATFELEK